VGTGEQPSATYGIFLFANVKNADEGSMQRWSEDYDPHLIYLPGKSPILVVTVMFRVLLMLGREKCRVPHQLIGMT
jgi:hypothetical protein